MPVPTELERLYDDHSQALFAFLLNFTRNEADTHDLPQELFIRLAKRPDLLKGLRDPVPFSFVFRTIWRSMCPITLRPA